MNASGAIGPAEARTLGKEARWIYSGVRLFCRFVLGTCFRVRAFGAEHLPAHGPVLIASSHQSYLDPILVGAFVRRPLQFMARDTLFRNRAFAWLIRTFNAFPVKRGTSDITSIRLCLRLLRASRAVLLFPEGTRTSDGRIQPIQSGVVTLSRRSGAPIVPVTLEGVFEAWPRTRRFPRWARILVAYGEPVTLDDIADLDDRAAAAMITHRMRAMQNDLRLRAGRKPFEYADMPLAQDGSKPAEAVRPGATRGGTDGI